MESSGSQPGTSLDSPDSVPVEQVKEYVTRVESVLAESRQLLDSLNQKGAEQVGEESKGETSFQEVMQLCEKLSAEVLELYNVFDFWDKQEKIPAIEKSEVVRALGLIKRANVLTQNALRIAKEALGIPDPERQQAEIEMQLRSMGVIRG